MADDQLCWVAVIGLPSAISDNQIGPGKSCLCNRFMRQKEDDYIQVHPSSITTQDFVGNIVNSENFLFWGSAKKSTENACFDIKVVEQTDFYDDHTFKSFDASEAYDKRAIKTKILSKGKKYQYIDYDQVALNECNDSDLEMFPSDHKVSIDVFIYVFDVSQTDLNFVKQYNMVETIIKNVSKPLIIAFSKYDEVKLQHLESLLSLTSRKKVPVIQVSSQENINVDSVFLLAARLTKHNSRTSPKMSIVTYDDKMKVMKLERNEITRLYNHLVESSVLDSNITWSEFRRYSKDNKHYISYCETFGSEKAKSIFHRHIRNLTIKFIEKKKNMYLKDLYQVFKIFVKDPKVQDHEKVIEAIRNHPQFNEYFIALSDTKTWKSEEIEYDNTGNFLVPLDLLSEPEAVKCFEQRLDELKREKEQQELAEEFEKTLSINKKILPGLSLDDVLAAVDERFSKLSRSKSQSIYNDHQVVLSKQMKQEFEEMLLENTELFRSCIPRFSGDITEGAKKISAQLQQDDRWQNLNYLQSDREIMLLRHITVFVTGSRNNQQLTEMTNVEKSFKAMVLERKLARKEIAYATNLVIEEGVFNVVIISTDEGILDKWLFIFSQECSTLDFEGTTYTVHVRKCSPEAVDVEGKNAIHLIIGFYDTGDWGSFSSITKCFDRLYTKSGYKGTPSQLVYLDAKSTTVTVEEGARFARRLNCNLLSEDDLKESLQDVVSSNISLIIERTHFVTSPSNSFNKNVLNVCIRMLYDDDICIKEILNAVFKYQYGFVHPYEPGVYVVHTLLNNKSTLILFHVQHYLDRETFPEHGSLIVCKDSRTASLNNAKWYISEYYDVKSIGLVVIETTSSLSYLQEVLDKASSFNIPFVKVEQEQGNRRSSINTQLSPVDKLLHSVVENSVLYIEVQKAFISTFDSAEVVESSDSEIDEKNREEIDKRIALLKDRITRTSSLSNSSNSVGMLPGHMTIGHMTIGHVTSRNTLTSPPPYLTRLPDRHLSYSLSELRGDSADGSPSHWHSLPRPTKPDVTTSTPLYSTIGPSTPIYSTIGPKTRRSSTPHANEPFSPGTTPKSPPLPPRMSEFSETSSEGIDSTNILDVTNKSVSGGLVGSLPDSPAKLKRSTPSRFQKKKLTQDELELRRLEKLSMKLKKLEDKEKTAKEKEAKKRIKEISRKYKQSEKIKKTEKKPDLSTLKSFKPIHQLKESCYFGRPLTEIAPGGGVPFYISTCVEFLECHDLTIEGLYRKEGNSIQINQLCKQFEMAYTENSTEPSFEIVELDVSVHVVTSSIKKFFKLLPTPLIPKEYQTMIQAATEINVLKSEMSADYSKEISTKILEILENFPSSNRLTLAYMIRHLSRIAEQEKENKMGSNNLAIVFMPTLLQAPAEMLMNEELRTKYSNMVEFLIDNSDILFGPELPSSLPPEENDLYAELFHHGISRQKTQEEYEYIRRPKTYFNQMLRVGHVPSLVKQCVNYIEHGKITPDIYTTDVDEGIIECFVRKYEEAYAVDEHRNLNFRKELKNLTVPRSRTEESISTSTTTDSMSSISGDLSMSGTGERSIQEIMIETSIIAGVLKRYLSCLLIPVVPKDHHDDFLDILSVIDRGDRIEKVETSVKSLKQSHKLLLCYLLQHFHSLKDKNVTNIEQVFVPILFFGSSSSVPTTSTMRDFLNERSESRDSCNDIASPRESETNPSLVVPSSRESETNQSLVVPSPRDDRYDTPLVVPSSQGAVDITKYERVMECLIDCTDHLNYDYDTLLYGPLYEDVMDQDRCNATHYYQLPALLEEARTYDTPGSIPPPEPFYAAVNNTCKRYSDYTEVRYESMRSPQAPSPHPEPTYADPDELSELYDDDTPSNTYVDSPVKRRAESSPAALEHVPPPPRPPHPSPPHNPTAPRINSIYINADSLEFDNENK